jgi:3-polyprenyl-4-hydroxybenzoate decarboxylase
MPALYHKPETLKDIIDQDVARTPDHLGLTHALFSRWSDEYV